MSIAVFSRVHRWVGLVIAFIVVLLCLTGIALNHTSQFKLGSKAAPKWIASAIYGDASAEQLVFSVDDRAFSTSTAGLLVADNEELVYCGHLAGIAKTGEYLVASCPATLVILSDQAELVEVFSLSGKKFESVSGIVSGQEAAELYLVGENRVWLLDLDSMQISESALSPGLTPSTNIVPFGFSRPGAVINYERLMLDIHSGRALGGWGVWLVDLVAVGLLSLIVTGFLAWRAKVKMLQMD